MSLSLSLELMTPVVSTLEAPKVVIRLENRGPAPVDVVDVSDTSHLLGVEVLGPDGEPLRRMHGLGRQAMMSGARVDESSELAPLMPAELRVWEWDLSNYGYCFAAGHYRLRASYLDPTTGRVIASASEGLEVQTSRVSSLRVTRDAPVLDGVALLMRTEPRGEPVLRQYNAGRPLAAWYSAALQGPEDLEQVFLATSAFFDTASFDVFFLRWLVYVTPTELVAEARFRGGAPVQVRRAARPAGLSVIPSAVLEGDGTLLVFMSEDTGRIHAFAFEETGLEPRFDVAAPPKQSSEVVIRGDCDHLHVAVPKDGIHYLRAERTGKVVNARHVMRCSIPAVGVAFDPVAHLLKAAFVGGPNNRHVLLGAVRPEGPRRVDLRLRADTLDGEIAEVGWDFEPDEGEFHVLLSGKHGGLHYHRHDDPAVVLRDDAGPFFPTVVATRRVHLGYYRPRTGHRSYIVGRSDPHQEAS